MTNNVKYVALALVALTARATYMTYDQVAGRPYNVSYTDRAFTIDGKPTLLLGGSFHPPRMAFGDWPSLLVQAKADGLNHVQVYVFWNFHERVRGVVEWTEGTRFDLGGFFKAAAAANLFVNVRIGPYVCAEWQGGGVPLWLNEVDNLTCSRCAEGAWESEMRKFVVAVAEVMKPYLSRVGGPIIMAQIENELHLDPSDPYVSYCGELAASLALDIPWVMCNGASAAGTINTCNGRRCSEDGGYADTHAKLFPGQPLGWTEDWSFFATWGTAVVDIQAPGVALGVALWFAKGGSHHNYYMYYGGNHIEHWSSASLTNRYADGSPLYSDTLRNEPKASHLGAMHRALAAVNDDVVASPIVTQASADVLAKGVYAYPYGNATFIRSDLTATQKVSYRGADISVAPGVTIYASGVALFNTQDVKTSGIACNKTYTPIASVAMLQWDSWAEPIPYAGGDEVGSKAPKEQLTLTREETQYMYYRTTLSAAAVAAATAAAAAGSAASVNLTIATKQSSAFVLWIDGEYVGETDDRTKGDATTLVNISVPTSSLRGASATPRELVLLSVSLGIYNFFNGNTNVPNNAPHSFRKGIVEGGVTLGGVNITLPDVGGWNARPKLGGELLNASHSDGGRVAWAAVPSASTRATWYRARFANPQASMPSDSVLLLDAKGLSRGHFYVNGHDLGRFWPLVNGSTRHYYVPLDVLLDSTPNVLTVFDELGAQDISTVRFVYARLELPLNETT